MLEPLLRFQANGTQAYALPDLGRSNCLLFFLTIIDKVPGHSYPKVDGGEPDSDTAKYLGVEGLISMSMPSMKHL